MQISPTSRQVLRLLFENSEQGLYVNELIRKTSLYPNSIYRALKTLEKQKILTSSYSGRFKYYHINHSYGFISEIKEIVGDKTKKGPTGTVDELDWVKILNRQTSYSFTSALCVSNVTSLKKIYGVSVPTFWHNSITFGVYYLKDELARLGKAISEKIEADLNFAKKDIALCRKTCDQLVKTSKMIPLANLPSMSSQELSKLLKVFYLDYLNVFPFVTVPHGIENYFENKIMENVPDEEDLKVLMSPISTRDEERDSALRIASYAKERGFDKTFYRLLDKHCEDFCWLTMWSIHAEPLTRDYFEIEIKNILDKVESPKLEAKKNQKEETKAKIKLHDKLKRLKASAFLTERVRLLQEYIGLRIYRKNAICQAHYYHLPLLNEMAKRLGLTSEEIKLLSYEEILDGISRKVPVGKLRKLIKARQQGWAILMRRAKVRTITGVKEIIEAMEQFRIIAPASAMQRIVKGRVACRGRVTGKVKIVRKLSELSKIEQGDILVAKMTTPDYIMAMHKAAAIVTDEGGITCHAAIVAREFNIPCITSTRNATQILADNDFVEVDAVEGIVRVVEAVEAPENIRVIFGRTIYKGKVRGPARIVLDASDFAKVKSGDILIAPQTTPEYLSSLYRVKGFVVDEESLTSQPFFTE